MPSAPPVAGAGAVPEVGATASVSGGGLELELGPVISSRAAYPATVDAVPIPRSIATFFKMLPQAALLLRAAPR